MKKRPYETGKDDRSSSPNGLSIEDIEDKRKREEKELMFFTEELDHAYSKIFRFLKD